MGTVAPEPALRVLATLAVALLPASSLAAEPPDDAPNVVLVLLDDVGFGQPSTFGGPVPMPTLDRLAAEGLRYTRLHTAGADAATRIALLTGREAAGARTRPEDAVPLAEVLRRHGWATAAFGRANEMPPAAAGPAGPFEHWPTGSGFEVFRGVVGAQANPTSPVLYAGTSRVETPVDPAFHLTTDLTDAALGWLRTQHAVAPERPFFLYFAPTSGSVPQQAPEEFVEDHTGRFDDGWDVVRKQTLARQKRLGVVPSTTLPAPRPDWIPAWSTLSEDERALMARQAEVHAGALTHLDHELGRLVDELKALGELDDTLILVVAGDQGASGRGGEHGALVATAAENGIDEPLEVQLKHMHLLGGPRSYGIYAAGWAFAGNAPYPWPAAPDDSGVRTGMIVRWPDGVPRPGAIRAQVQHVTDVAPTILAAVGLGDDAPATDGVSFARSFGDRRADTGRTTLVLGRRAILQDGWLARAVGDDGTWALYDTRVDPGLAADLAEERPEQVDALLEALDDATAGWASAPEPKVDRDRLVLRDGVVGLPEATLPPLRGRDVTVTAKVRVPQGGAEGPIVAQGGRFGGWALHLDAGRPTFTYAWVGLKRTVVQAEGALSPGRHTVSSSFTIEPGGPGAGGRVVVQVDGEEVARGRLDATHARRFGAGETADVGADLGAPVSETYAKAPRFTGRVDEVVIELGPADPGVWTTRAR